MNTKLYRYFDELGQLLYVGVSVNAIVRMSQHRQTAEWFDQAASITVEPYATRELALEAETTAIRSEEPLFNIRGRSGCACTAEEVQVHSTIGSLVNQVNSMNVYKVMFHLIELYAREPVIKSTRLHLKGKSVAEHLEIAPPELSRCLKVLTELTFIIDKGYGFVELNPKFVWKGTLQDRETLLIKEDSK